MARVLVTGAYGLIGSACLARLKREGHDVTGFGRSVASAQRRFPYAGWIAADFRDLSKPENWASLIAGFDAVVNCVGVLQAGAGDDVRAVHVTATIALFEACAGAKIRLVHISALGVEAGTSEFSRSKTTADRHLQTLDLDWVILRPGLVLAPAVYGGTAMLRGIAGFPGVTPVVGAERRVQVVAIDDVTRTVAWCLKDDAPAKITWDVAHPEFVTLAEIAVAVRRWLGFPPRRMIALPGVAQRAVAVFADALGWLGWRSPARTTTFAQLASGVTGNPRAWIETTGIAPQSLADILAARPADVQERWFARLYWLKPAAIGLLALNWIAAGIPTLLMVLTGKVEALGVSGLARSAVTADAALSLIVGVAVLVRTATRFALCGMIALALAEWLGWGPFSARPAYDSIAALLNVLAASLAPLFVLAILDDR